MNFDKLFAAWSGQASEPNPDPAALVSDLRRLLAQREAHQRRMLIFAGIMLLWPLSAMLLDLLTGQAQTIDLTREWGIVPFVLVPFAALYLVARGRSAAAVVRGETLLEGFRALRAENSAAIRRIKIMVSSIVVVAPFLIVLLNQLVATGKMRTHEMESALLVLGGGLLCSLVWMAAKFALKLVPERRRLNVLIAQYDQAAQI